jgi:exopolyphosphatase / guanosine-5'-triphosphate,3'-diphosphate pyrophosphatase
VRIAVLDLGTNSTRLLVADVRDGKVEEVERKTSITRLGQDVDRTGRLAPEAMERVYETVAGYREIVDELGAKAVVAVATSAVRDSANGDELRETLNDRYGVAVKTITGDEEARLTFLGATSGRPDDSPTLVLDIGGGSTEFVVGTPGRDPGFHVSTQVGSVRQTERHLTDDPPPPRELTEMAEEVSRTIDDQIPPKVREDTTRGIAVAGTATSLAAIDQELDPYDPEKVHGYVLAKADAERILGQLAAVTLEQRQQIAGLHPQRAPTIVAGAVILVQAMRAFALDEIETSEADILHGAALDYVPDKG